MRHSTVALLALLLIGWALPATGQFEPPEPSWDPPLRDPDDSFVPPPAPLPYPLATYDFEGCSPQGWTTHDMGRKGRFFHVDDFMGFPPPYAPLSGAKSLWCGLRGSVMGTSCAYMTPPGYGNGWDQRWTTKECLEVTGEVTVSFTARWDMEPSYDYAQVEYRHCLGPATGPWIPISGTIGSPRIAGSGGPVSASFSFTDHEGTVHIRVRVVSDDTYSDEDGNWNTSGAIIIDDLRVDDASGVVVALESFESETSGSTDSDDWDGEPANFGDHAGIVYGSTMIQEDPYVNNMSCMWAFVEAPVNNFSCEHELVPAVRKGPVDGQFLRNAVWSPEVTFAGPVEYGTVLEFSAYSDLPVNNLVFYEWHVRELLVGSGCWSEWRNDNRVYSSDDPLWHHKLADLTPYLSSPSTISKIQVSLGVIDMFPNWSGMFGDGMCHTHAPMFDDVRITRSFGRVYVPRTLSLFQDRFAEDGTLTGTVRMDGAEDDLLRIQVADAGDGIANPGVFLHVKNLPNKSGPAISGGPEWPYVPAMSDAEWTVLQMAPAGDHEYNVDLNDHLYQPGDVVRYYVSSVTKGGLWAYWSYFTGNVSEVTAREHPMEVSCLPTPPQEGIKRGLYVDATSGFGAQPLIENSMKNLGLVWDRFDRNSPLDNRANSLGSVIGNPLLLENYEFVLWDAGDITSPFTDLDYGAMALYLSQVKDARLCIMGSKAAKAIATSQSPAAQFLRSNHLSFSLITDDHKSLGMPLSPQVKGVAQGNFPGQFYAHAQEGTVGKMDVVGAVGPSCIEMHYGNDAGAGAFLVQESLGGFGPVKVVLATFGLSAVRDDSPGAASASSRIVDAAPDRTVLLDQILQYLDTPGLPPTGAPPVIRDYLSQNRPNPFNPTTTIHYSLSNPGPMSLRIYDVTGALVRVLVDDPRAPVESGMVAWDGRDDDGSAVPSGVYFYKLVSNNFTQTKKMVLLK